MTNDEREQKIGKVIREVVSRVGLTFSLSVAQRAQRCADELIETEDDEAIRYMVVEGFEKMLSNDFSKAKRASNGGVASAIHAPAGSKPGNGATVSQLAFPVIAPGQPPTPLGAAWNLLIEAALKSERAQLKGRQDNVALLERVAAATKAWPETPIRELLSKRLVTVEQLFGLAKARKTKRKAS